MDMQTALTQMRGKTIGLRLYPNGSARLQWPYADGTLPSNMMRFEIADARIDGNIVDIDLVASQMSFTFHFALPAIEVDDVRRILE